jgi:hypothetical protein
MSAACLLMNKRPTIKGLSHCRRSAWSVNDCSVPERLNSRLRLGRTPKQECRCDDGGKF